ncbi:LysR family transcriptional regulator [Streptomyces liangshanensis]|uniref:LysR family transcriptional regulator n=1 Tax=Streptomyces liangshanensis TaxID=2717324 RepID=A0A6G9GSQ4_9ACTN|nr:LysR family transcriptional regulator [Streptomyces liangshanensis]QIQ01255.1 LysR family transcriptional regulator [Streptomyces liangshanensis]
MELRTLGYFVAVAEEESFSRAAERCRVAQPAVSQQIRSLERELGEQLFERRPRSVVLTPAGRVLMPYARDALAAVASAKAEFAAREGVLTGDLTLGSVDGVEITPLPRMLGTFRSRYPDVTVRLVGGTSSALLDQVRHGALDAAAIAHPLQPLEDSLGHRTLLRDEIVAVVRRDRREARQTSITLQELAGTALISYGPDNGLHPAIDEAFRRADLRFAPAYATNDVALLVALAVEGVGIAVAAGADPEVHLDPRVIAVPVTPRIPYRKVLVWRRVPAPAAPLRALLALSEPYLAE